MTTEAEQSQSRPLRHRPLLRLLETVLVWLLVVGLFAGLAIGVFLVVKDSPARLIENLRLAGANTSYSSTVPAGAHHPMEVGPVAAEPLTAAAPGMSVTNPSWATAPNPVFPRAAMLARAEHGRVSLRCRLNTEGRLTMCEILDETPASVGFADAALEAASHARLTPRTVNGAPVGGVVQFGIRFELR